MLVTEIDLHTVSEAVWNAMLGFDIRPCEFDGFCDDERLLTGSVQITGDWNAVVIVQVPYSFAKRAAATMFGIEDDETSDEEVTDSLGEIANMIGGNAKAMLEGTTSLGLPEVIEGRDIRFCIPGAKVLVETTYRCEHWIIRTQLFGLAS